MESFDALFAMSLV
jgi:hypothetical protein